jgi:MFS family permease
MTLAGSIAGQLLFGWLGDRYGRTRLYGIELAIVIFSTIGVASVSGGYLSNMSILAWLSVWRFVMGVIFWLLTIFRSRADNSTVRNRLFGQENPGPVLRGGLLISFSYRVGIGAEYPLSAVITAESVSPFHFIQDIDSDR